MDNLEHKEESAVGDFTQEQRKQAFWRVVALCALFFSILSCVGLGLFFFKSRTYWGSKPTVVAGEALGPGRAIRNLNPMKVDKKSDQGKASGWSVIAGQVQSQQKSLEELKQVLREISRNRYQQLLEEIEYGLGIVILQILDTGSTELAEHTLIYLGDRLSAFNYAELEPLKKSLNEDIKLLRQQESGSHLSSALVKIDVLMEKVDVLPFLAESILDQPEMKREVRESANQPLHIRFWETLIDLVRSGVEVRHLDKPDPLLLNSQQIALIKENIKLHLLNARLALMQRQQTAYVQYLGAIRGAVRKYFDLKNGEVSNFLGSLDMLIKINLGVPDITPLKNTITLVKSLQVKDSKLSEESPEAGGVRLERLETAVPSEVESDHHSDQLKKKGFIIKPSGRVLLEKYD
ncbi:MAG: uroporphyrinogen-III C-methyltransferase [Neisseriaceae bacterium]